ncbi:MAG: hypothetical protein E4H14_05020 [Candidatus Thorarchaeota archaeon]|nr:MAG: hypothetical protein E4H14_05020 [Candidatus Thorarchaeota archaeon]
MKIQDIIKETAFKSKKWREGYDAFYDGKHTEDCPYEDEERSQWIEGWQRGSQEE